MGDFSMTVLMGMRVGMFMRVLKLDCVFNHKIEAQCEGLFRLLWK